MQPWPSGGSSAWVHSSWEAFRWSIDGYAKALWLEQSQLLSNKRNASCQLLVYHWTATGVHDATDCGPERPFGQIGPSQTRDSQARRRWGPLVLGPDWALPIGLLLATCCLLSTAFPAQDDGRLVHVVCTKHASVIRKESRTRTSAASIPPATAQCKLLMLMLLVMVC